MVSQKLGSQRIPWETVSRVDLQVGTRRPVPETMLLGGAVGALIGLFAPLSDSCDSIASAPPPPPPPVQYSGDPICSRGEQVGAGFAGGAVLGLLGAYMSDGNMPKWKRLRPPYQRPSGAPAVSFQLRPAGRGVSAQFALSF